VAEAISAQASSSSTSQMGKVSHTQSLSSPTLGSSHLREPKNITEVALPQLQRPCATKPVGQPQLAPKPMPLAKLENNIVGNLKQDSIGPPPGSPPHTPTSDLIPSGKQQDSIGPPPDTPPLLQTPIRRGGDSIGPPQSTPPPLNQPSPAIMVPNQRGGGNPLLAQAVSRELRMSQELQLQKEDDASGTPFDDPCSALSLMQALSSDTPQQQGDGARFPVITGNGDQQAQRTAMSPLRFSMKGTDS